MKLALSVKFQLLIAVFLGGLAQASLPLVHPPSYFYAPAFYHHFSEDFEAKDMPFSHLLRVVGEEIINSIEESESHSIRQLRFIIDFDYSGSTQLAFYLVAHSSKNTAALLDFAYRVVRSAQFKSPQFRIRLAHPSDFEHTKKTQALAVVEYRLGNDEHWQKLGLYGAVDTHEYVEPIELDKTFLLNMIVGLRKLPSRAGAPTPVSEQADEEEEDPDGFDYYFYDQTSAP